MNVEAQAWLSAVNELSMCAYHLYQLDKNDSSLPLHVRRYIARQFEHKSYAWQQFSTGAASEFHHCSSEVSAALMSKRAELDPNFLRLLQERHTNFNVLHDLEFLLSAELAKPPDMQHASDIVFTIKSIKESLATQLCSPDATAMIEAAQALHKTKLVALINKLAGLLAL